MDPYNMDPYSIKSEVDVMVGMDTDLVVAEDEEDEEDNTDDLEVASVLAKGVDVKQGGSLQGSRAETSRTGSQQGSSPRRPSTAMTNLSRGNTKTVTPFVAEMPSIHQLAAQGDLTALKAHLALDAGCDVNATDHQGVTSLTWACIHNQVAMATFLLQLGASPKLTCPRGVTPLMYASNHGHLHVVKLLLSRRVPVNQEAEDGNTALLYAAHAAHPPCVRALLAWGADLTHTNAAGLGAMDIAIRGRHREVQTAIEAHLLALLEQC